MDQNKDIFAKIMDDEQFAETVKNWLMKQVYKKLLLNALLEGGWIDQCQIIR